MSNECAHMKTSHSDFPVSYFSVRGHTFALHIFETWFIAS